MEATEQKMAKRMQNHFYEMTESKEYQVRKFPNY
ncbi:hypothetical protein CY0110_18177 [Crocosphaera chwakensis CCY0110]|uniref:Uncharacterized protein n=1 Tax=Crocosphaera chwakensis CCY0110 TaxID=391612 RepID=A3IIW7_9CHRO|nr:hypothetical protein CY0110_18177 [Crocosphaera chwakensis CCY0110]